MSLVGGTWLQEGPRHPADFHSFVLTVGIVVEGGESSAVDAAVPALIGV